MYKMFVFAVFKEDSDQLGTSCLDKIFRDEKDAYKRSEKLDKRSFVKMIEVE